MSRADMRSKKAWSESSPGYEDQPSNFSLGAREEPCPRCYGTGIDPSTGTNRIPKAVCPECGGTKVRKY